MAIGVFDIMYLICHVTLHDHLIKGWCKYIGGSTSQYVTTLVSLVNIGIMTLIAKDTQVVAFVYPVNMQNYLIKLIYDFLVKSPSW